MKVGHGPNILVSHTLNTVMTFSDPKWIQREGEEAYCNHLVSLSIHSEGGDK